METRCFAVFLLLILIHLTNSAVVPSDFKPNDEEQDNGGLKMSYHDNNVYLHQPGPFGLGSYNTHYKYEVTSYKISSGQDPHNHIYEGYTTESDSGTLSFSVGRHGTGDVADWFNDKIPSDSNTFGHGAGSLNFAFLGTLTISFTYNSFGNKREDYVFTNIGLAQGHSGASNNWWFGGESCSKGGSGNQVKCQGTEQGSGRTVAFSFIRGDGVADSRNASKNLRNSDDSVDISSVSVFSGSSWMSMVDQSKTLNDIVIPGSHDSGMSSLSHCFPNGPVLPITEGATKTQYVSLLNQMYQGFRYFDIRIDYDHDQLVTYHRTGADGCNGVAFEDVLNQASQFLAYASSETLIFKISHIRDYSGHDPTDTKNKIDDMISQYAGQDIFYTNGDANVNLAKQTLGSVAGKIILVFDYDEHVNPQNGRFRYHDYQGQGNLVVYDSYSDTSDYNKMLADQTSKWQNYGGNQDYLFLLSFTLTTSIGDILDLASTADGHLQSVLNWYITVGNYPKPNIVFIDGIDDSSGLDHGLSIYIYNLW